VPGPASDHALTEGELRRRRDRLADYLDAWGDLRVDDLGSGGRLRLLQFALEAPGESLPIEVKAVYREYYRRRRDGDWVIVKYTHEYLDLSRMTRLAYHLHDLGTRRRVPHAHCDAATKLPLDEDAHHFRAVELDLREAHEEFMRLWASDTEPDCRTLRPLEIQRTL
jgi:hypothetical protein